MADFQKPGPTKRALPFKRTARPAQSSNVSPIDDDGLSLFSQSKNYFSTVAEEQKRRAQEKAAQAEKERQEKLARQQEEEREAREAKLLKAEREREEAEAEKEAAKKRRRPSISSNDEEKNDTLLDDDDPFTDRPRKSRKSSTPYSPEVAHGANRRRMSRGSDRLSLRPSSRKVATPVVLLDDSEDEDSKLGVSSLKIQSSASRTDTTHLDSEKAKARDDDSDSDLEIFDEKLGEDGGEGADKEEDPSEFYIRQAMERMRKEKEAREARESSAAGERDKSELFEPGVNDEPSPPVSVMIAAPALPDARPICCQVRTSQALQIAFDTFKERLKTQTKYPHAVILGLYFTWRGDRVYETTKLETLGIRPRGQDGRLYDAVSSGRNAPEGYMGRDKVYFEAWTPEEYEENQAKRERARKRREMGEWWDEDETNEEDSAPAAEVAPPQEEERVKVIFKARDMPPRNLTLRKYSTVAQMGKAFRKLTGLGEDKQIEIRWDGEVLDPETTVEEADIQDMDSVEVHIR